MEPERHRTDLTCEDDYESRAIFRRRSSTRRKRLA